MSNHVAAVDRSDQPDCLLEMRGIGKQFPGVTALRDVDLRLRAGSVHALVGENGAGKSTLMKILIGLITDFTGDIFLSGNRLSHRGVRQALDQGIAMIHQELNYVPHLTIAQNIFLGKEPTRGLFGWIDQPSLVAQTHALLKILGVDLNPNRLMKDLSVAQQQMVEIAKALSYQAKVIIMDEPTSALSEREVRRLLTLVGELRDRGCAVIYITHRLDEVFEIADEVTVLRDGCLVGTFPVSEVTPDRLITLMVGRTLDAVFPKRTDAIGAEALSVQQLCKDGVFQEISFAVRRGEILGVAGLIGAGRTEVIRCLFGLEPFDSGQVFVDQKPVVIQHPKDAIRHGLGLVCEDRQITGLIPCLSLCQNMSLTHLELCSRGAWILDTQEQQMVERMMKRLAIKANNTAQSVNTLSGGNQQKIVFGKALLGEPAILILDEPTRGIDVGAKAEIYQLIRTLANRGKAILLVSSDLTEILGMSSRIIVVREGRIVGNFDRDEATPEIIMRHALAGNQNG
jgi:inositol transport system ATP-binding protein